jgi:acyl-CoA synthetase (AMP-forming)/AMP-acid ligase II
MVHVLQTLNPKAIVVDLQSNAAVQWALAALHSSSVFPCCPILTWDMDHLPPDQRARSIHGLLAAAADADDDDDDYNDDAGSRVPSVASSHWKIPPDASNADTCAFLCFTSGTTRAPKAVCGPEILATFFYTKNLIVDDFSVGVGR